MDAEDFRQDAHAWGMEISDWDNDTLSSLSSNCVLCILLSADTFENNAFALTRLVCVKLKPGPCPRQATIGRIRA